MKEINKKRSMHGMSKSSFYNSWINMKGRCLNKRATHYYRYGGRGIGVCSEWGMFENFKRDMLPTFKKGLHIERINNNGNYCKENCRWATRSEQQRNTCRNVNVTIRGITKCVADWAEVFKIPRIVIYQRTKLGWDAEQAVLQKYESFKKK